MRLLQFSVTVWHLVFISGVTVTIHYVPLGSQWICLGDKIPTIAVFCPYNILSPVARNRTQKLYFSNYSNGFRVQHIKHTEELEDNHFRTPSLPLSQISRYFTIKYLRRVPCKPPEISCGDTASISIITLVLKFTSYWGRWRRLTISLSNAPLSFVI